MPARIFPARGNMASRPGVRGTDGDGDGDDGDGDDGGGGEFSFCGIML